MHRRKPQPFLNGVIVSSAPTLEAYAMAAGAAAVERRDVVLIETRVPHEAEWATFVKKHAPAARSGLNAPSPG